MTAPRRPQAAHRSAQHEAIAARRLSSRAHDPVRLSARRRATLYAVTAVLLATGAAWLWIHLRRVDDALPSPLEPWLMKLHGAAAMVSIYIAGTLLYGHMRAAWRRRVNRAEGSIVAAALALLALTGYGLYYFDGDGLRQWTEWVHWSVGFAVPALLWWHISRGRSSRGR